MKVVVMRTVVLAYLIPLLAAAWTGAAAANDAPASDGPAMWRVADEDTEIVFLGTFHILPPGLEWRTATMNEKLSEADAIYFEVDTAAPDAISKTRAVMETHGEFQDGGALTETLSADDSNALRDIVASLGLRFEGVNAMRPWNAFLTLSVQFILQQGFQPGSGVDTVLLMESKIRGKDIRFFETIEQQLGFFTALPPDVEQRLLELTIRDWEKQTETFDDLVMAWRDGDIDFIDEEMNRLMRDVAPDAYDSLIADRNRAWADELERALNEETGVIFV
ncbi:MAG: TraB/GumN family protein, partial [Pseudomonadota bacterium]